MSKSCSDTKELSNLKNFKRTPKILLVEDEQIVQRVHIEFLKTLECFVDLAKDGVEALKMFKNNYDLILMDIGLPDISGLESSNLIRRREQSTKQRIPIIAFTCFDNLDKHDCEWAGIDDLLIKPAPPEELETMLKKWLPHLLKKF